MCGSQPTPIITTLDNEAVAADDDEMVTLSSVHQAKCLKWTVIFDLDDLRDVPDQPQF